MVLVCVRVHVCMCVFVCVCVCVFGTVCVSWYVMHDTCKYTHEEEVIEG